MDINGIAVNEPVGSLRWKRDTDAEGVLTGMRVEELGVRDTA